MTWKRYTSSEMHRLLADRQTSDYYDQMAHGGEWIAAQALFCPYYVPLAGPLATDWGVILNPSSPRFGLLTFEHDWCGCPPEVHADQDGDQSGVDWLRPKRVRLWWRKRLCGEDRDG